VAVRGNTNHGILFGISKFAKTIDDLSSLKSLASQTFWYGASSIAARFLSYLLTPYLTAIMTGVDYGEMSIMYAAIPFLTVIFTYGMETAFFRFMQKEQYKGQVYSTSCLSIIISTATLALIMFAGKDGIARLLTIKDHPEYFTLSIAIISIDTLSTLPFAKLRFEGRPMKYAAIRIAGILINIGLVILFLSVIPAFKKANPHHPISIFYKDDQSVAYYLIANLISSAATFLLLSGTFFSFSWKFDFRLWKEMMTYSLPLVIVGFGGVINETFDRIMLGWWSPALTPDAKKLDVGIYSACYKLSLLITLFVQAFRMGAEPFFFKQAEVGNAQKTYARVMKFFVITVCVMFLVVVLYLEIWKNFIRNPVMWEGLKVVPVLLLANMFLGIYYNLSIWYKLSNRTMAGAYITIIGAGITLLINYFFVPHFSYVACAWATCICYGTMMVISFIWGQKEYPVPYAWKKLVAYIVIVVLLYFIQRLFYFIVPNKMASMAFGTILLLGYISFILKVERKEFQKLPVIGKFIK
jgi:O-antigen/teichoic acid export membrane protein